MSEKPITVAEIARMGGVARSKAHRKAELRKWGKQDSRPARLDRSAESRLTKMLADGK